MVNVETREVRVSGADGPVRTHAAGFAALWLLWLAMLAGAMISGNVLEGHGKALPTALRMGSSVVLVVTAWWAWTLWRATTAGRFALLIAIGMTLGTIGDFFNADLLNFIPINPPVLGGIAAFGLGHIAYITGCVNLARRAGLTNRTAFVIGIVGWQLIGLIGWYYVAY